MGILKAELYKKLICFVFAIFVLQFCPLKTFAQYTPSEIDPLMKWSQIKTKNLRVVFPKHISKTGYAIASYIDTLSPYITRGLGDKLYDFPILVHSTNILSNGMVTWAPKRMELFSIPSRNTHATQWLKQLTSHEYRHVAQMSTLNVGFTKFASYILGQQAPGIVSALLPGYFLEGDAVLNETLTSTFGRGRQPEFNIEYRAILENNEILFRKNNPNKLNYNKMVLGSFKDNVPDNYKTGYLLVGAANRYYGVDFWKKAVEYTGRYPFLFVTVAMTYNKHAKTTPTKHSIRTFKELKKHWEELDDVQNSATVLNPKTTSYTTYSHPLPLTENLIVVLKKDLDRASRFVVIDKNTSKEQLLFYTGYVTSRPIIKDNIVYWTEYLPSKFYGQQNFSVVKSVKLSVNTEDKVSYKKFNKHKVDEIGAFYVTAVADKGFAMVGYDRENMPTLIFTDTNFKQIKSYVFDWFDASFNGLTWDNKTNKLVAVILNNEGMWIGEFNEKTHNFDKITRPSYVTIKDLTASDGLLYYTSISTGKDEVHAFDLSKGVEYQITNSKFGSFAPMPSSLWSQKTDNSAEILLTNYSIKGYFPAKQKIDLSSAQKLAYRYIPIDYLSVVENDSISQSNLQKYPVINLDTLSLDSSVLGKYKVKKYRKAANLFNVHSWAPMYFDIDRIINERELAVGAGVNILSQNLHSTLISGLSLGYSQKSFALGASANYTALPVHFSVKLNYGGGYQNVDINGLKTDVEGKDKYLSVGGSVSLPMNLSSGVNNRRLTLKADMEYVNTLLLSDESEESGITKMSFSAIFQNYKSYTQKQLAPRWGYTLQAYSNINPLLKDFGSIYGAYAKGYFPGILKNHSTQLAVLAQYQDEGKFNFMQKGLFPLGAFDDFTAKRIYSLEGIYKAPLFYPDWGLGGIIYFKRVSMSVFAQYSNAEPTRNYDFIVRDRNFYSYGGGLNTDIKIFRVGVPINVGFLLYKTNTVDGLCANFEFSLQL